MFVFVLFISGLFNVVSLFASVVASSVTTPQSFAMLVQASMGFMPLLSRAEAITVITLSSLALV